MPHHVSVSAPSAPNDHWMGISLLTWSRRCPISCSPAWRIAPPETPNFEALAPQNLRLRLVRVLPAESGPLCPIRANHALPPGPLRGLARPRARVRDLSSHFLSDLLELTMACRTCLCCCRPSPPPRRRRSPAKILFGLPALCPRGQARFRRPRGLP